MSDGERSGLAARIAQVRRLAAARDAPAPPDDRVQALETRLAHLEQLVEGLQDSVYRESERHAKLIAELQEQIKPGPMGESLADDARRRRR